MCFGMAAVGSIAVVPRAASAEVAASACVTLVKARQTNALATIFVSNDCRPGIREPVAVTYAGNSFQTHLDEFGTAKVSFALFKPSGNQIAVRLADEPPSTYALDVPEFESVKRVTLLWHAPVRLKLHVVEPGGRLGQLGSISEDQPNLTLTRGLGSMDLVTPPPADGADQDFAVEQSYVNPAGDQPGVISYYVEYASQGAMPAPPFCGEGALATIPYRLIVHEGGKVRDDVQYETARAPCGVTVSRLQRRVQ